MKDEEYAQRCMSIVVPVYNREALLERSLDSLYAQTWRPIHVIVVDNASSDLSASKARQWGERHSGEGFSFELLSDSRHGAAYARQTGLEAVKTRHVCFFDSDDAMQPDEVKTSMEIFLSDSSVDIVGWPITFVKESGNQVTHSLEGDVFERHLVHGVLRTEGYAVRTDFLRKAGGWNGEFPVWNDFETGVRLLLNNPVVKAVDSPMSDVYPQAVSITGTDYSSKAGQWERSLNAARKYIENSDHPSKQRLLNIVDYRQAILAAHYRREGRKDLGRPLLKDVLQRSSRRKSMLLRFAYQWTALGMRGAYSIIGKWL